jgi:hypothetical protein
VASLTLEQFEHGLADLVKHLRVAKRNNVRLNPTSFYGQKVWSSLASLRKSLIGLQRDYPVERYGRVAFQLASIDPLLQKLTGLYPAAASELLPLALEISFKAKSDLSAEIEAAEKSSTVVPEIFFVPNELIEDRHYVLKKVLWEINNSYDSACYNACAAMIRRLTESLIVQAFEHHGIEAQIKKDDNFLDFSELIGKAIAEPKLGLTRNTKRILPDLKFFGDLASHNRKALVRKEDLDKLHQAIRSAIEELAGNL